MVPTLVALSYPLSAIALKRECSSTEPALGLDRQLLDPVASCGLTSDSRDLKKLSRSKN